MAFRFRQAAPIYGIVVPPRRFTRWAAVYFLLFFCLPVLGACLAIDVTLYLLFAKLLDSCYALLCLIE